MTVTLCFFVAARVTTLDIKVGEDPNVFGVSDGLQEFFNLGFLGAIITTILGSISWQLVASAFPIAFLSNIFVFILLNIALAIEFTGICAASWFFGSIHKKIAGFQLDEVYVGTAEERAAGGKADTSIHPGREFNMGTTVNLTPAELAAAVDNTSPTEKTSSERREAILAKITEAKEMSKTASPSDQSKYESIVKSGLEELGKLNAEEGV